MPFKAVLKVDALPPGSKRVVTSDGVDVLLIHHDDSYSAVQAKCPHAGAPLDEGAICNGRLICPWHMATFSLPSGELLEPPAMEPLQTYEVKIENNWIAVDFQARPPAEVVPIDSTKDKLFLIAGGGAAGSMAAVTLRQNGFAGDLVVVEPHPEEPVDRTQLSKDALGGKIPLDEIRSDALAKAGARVISASVSEFSCSKKHALLNDGTTIQFDKALIATGGLPRRLPIPGAEMAHTIRHTKDVEQILRKAEGAKHVAIVGTSFIGLEAASALVQKGLKVTVIGREKLPFQKQFGDEVSKAFLSLHETGGTQFELGVDVEAITEAGVTIKTADQLKVVPAEMVIMGVGVDPALGFSHDLPIVETGGVKTDDSLKASDEVWAAGDIADVNGFRIEHWRVAEQQGRRAALSMLGREEPSKDVPYFWTYHFGERVGYLGHLQSWDSVVFSGDLNEFRFIAFYEKNGSVGAVLGCGFEAELATLAEMLRKPITVIQVLKTL